MYPPYCLSTFLVGANCMRLYLSCLHWHVLFIYSCNNSYLLNFSELEMGCENRYAAAHSGEQKMPSRWYVPCFLQYGIPMGFPVNGLQSHQQCMFVLSGLLFSLFRFW